MASITRYVGGLGYAGRPLGSFAGKTQTDPEPEPEPEVTSTGGHYAKGERRRRGLEWGRREALEDRLQRVYDRLHGDLAEVAEPADVREAVAEHATASDAAIPPPAAIDFGAMARDAAAVTALLAAYEKALEAKAEADDEEDAVIALLLA